MLIWIWTLKNKWKFTCVFKCVNSFLCILFQSYEFKCTTFVICCHFIFWKRFREALNGLELVIEPKKSVNYLFSLYCYFKLLEQPYFIYQSQFPLPPVLPLLLPSPHSIFIHALERVRSPMGRQQSLSHHLSQNQGPPSCI